MKLHLHAWLWAKVGSKSMCMYILQIKDHNWFMGVGMVIMNECTIHVEPCTDERDLGAVPAGGRFRFQNWMIIGVQQSSILDNLTDHIKTIQKWMLFDWFLYRGTEWHNKHPKVDEIDCPNLDGKHLHHKLDDINHPDSDESNSC